MNFLVRARHWSLLSALSLTLSASAFAGTQVVNGDFHDAATFGDDVGWTQVGYGPNFQYASPGQASSTSCLFMTATNADPLQYIEQDVTIASGPNVPFLDFYYQGTGGDGNVAGGGQRMQILNTSNVVQATVLDVSLASSSGWVHVSYNVSAYVGQTIRLYFAARGSAGHGAVLYLDSISINYAAYTPTTTVSPSPTRSSTRTPSFTVSPTQTRSPTPSTTPTYQPPSQVQNGDFSASTANWTITGDTSPTSIIKSPGASGGTYFEAYAWSSFHVASASQTVYVAALGQPQLQFWYRPSYFYGNNNPSYNGIAVTGNAQYFQIRNPYTHAVLDTPLLTTDGSNSGWISKTVDLAAYVGTAIELTFGTSVFDQDQATMGFSNIGIVYGTPTPSPTYSATPTDSPSPTVTSTVTITPTSTRSPTPTNSPSSTCTITATPTWSASVTPSITPTNSPTPSVTRSWTASVTPTITATSTKSPTPSITPTFSVSPTITVTPQFLASGLGRTVAGPVPARGTDPICLYFDKAPMESHWNVYNTVGQRVANLDFEREPSQCWGHKSVSTGFYYLLWNVRYADGDKANGVQKVVIVP